jgi:hypothetical protein
VKDRRFIELLNLYLDHQIGADEAAELETEVMRNPARRRTYEQYCRLQRGCGLLGERERSAAPASVAFARSLREAERKIAEPRGRASWWSPAYAGAFAASAMAACVAVIVVVKERAPSTTGGTENILAQVPVVPTQVSEPPVPTETALAVVIPADSAGAVQPMLATFELQPTLAASGFNVARNAREAEIALGDRQVLEWMQRVEQSGVQSIVVDDQAFETRATLHPDNRVFRSRHGLQGNAEFTAFQFQR